MHYYTIEVLSKPNLALFVRWEVKPPYFQNSNISAYFAKYLLLIHSFISDSRLLKREENRINCKLSKFDSTQSLLYAEVTDRYTGFIKSLSEKSKNISNVNLHQYNSYTDTLTTSLSFLTKFSGSSSKSVLPLATLNQLKDKFNQSEKINEFISERKKTDKGGAFKIYKSALLTAERI